MTNVAKCKSKADGGGLDPAHNHEPANQLFFDNRHQPLSHHRIYRPKKTITRWKKFRRFGLSRFVPYYLGGDVHYAFPHNGQHFLFAFIRKNASSSFVRFLSTKLSSRSDQNDHIMRRLYLAFTVKSRAQLDCCQYRFFIYRDPVERLVSLFNNKFVQNANLEHSHHEGLIYNFEHIAQTRHLDTTFSDFVRTYLQRYFRLFSGRWLLDEHVFPQADHLWPVYYTHVIRFERLHEDISDVLGKDTADTYFSRKVNASSTKRYDDPSSNTTVADLHRRFAETGELPSLRAYVDDELEAIIRNLYAIDYELAALIGIRNEAGSEKV